MNTAALSPMGWDTEDEQTGADGVTFTHPSTNDGRIEVEVTDDYLFLSTLYHDGTDGKDRAIWMQGWTVDDGALLPNSQTGNYGGTAVTRRTGN